MLNETATSEPAGQCSYAENFLLTSCQWGVVVTVVNRGEQGNKPVKEMMTSANVASCNRDETEEALQQLMLANRENSIFTRYIALALDRYPGHLKASRLPDGCQRRKGLAGWQVKKAMSTLSDNLMDPVDLGRIAASTGLSRAHFSRAFKASTGLAPYQWRLERKLAQCRRLLIDTDLSLSDVARQSGFAESSYFSHAFHRATGMSPTQWRRVFRSSNAVT